MDAAGRTVVVRAPGKINVTMRVGARRDDGYHDVATVYQAVGLWEELRAEPDDELRLSFSGPIFTGALPVDRSNIVLRAAHLLQARTGHRGGAAMHVVKRVPIAGGMGGGSADAAAALVALDALWGTALQRDDLLELATELGADVPFAMTGGSAVGTRRGDRLSPALTTGRFHWVLALSEPGLSTPEVYTALDEHRERTDERAPASPQVEADVLQALRSGDAERLSAALHNDLQAAAMHLRPELADVLDLGLRNGALAGIVSGSGPTIAFLTADLDSALSLQIALSAGRLTALRATGPAQGARVVPAAGGA